MSVFEKIEAQQKGKEMTAPWMVGEQLKEILRAEPELCELVERDLDAGGFDLAECEKKIADWASHHKKGSCAVVPPNVAEGIIRKFYGLPEPSQAADAASSPRGGAKSGGDVIDIADFL